MILFDYKCEACDITEERCVSDTTKDLQECKKCGTIMLRQVGMKSPKAFNPHFDVALGEFLTCRQDRDNAIQDIRERSIQRIPVEQRRIYKAEQNRRKH